MFDGKQDNMTDHSIPQLLDRAHDAIDQADCDSRHLDDNGHLLLGLLAATTAVAEMLHRQGVGQDTNGAWFPRGGQ